MIDGAAYYQAVREALRAAQERVVILGWDLHSQTPLVGETGEPDDGLPRLFGDFIVALESRRPRLEIYLLAWDFAAVFAMDRELFPRLRFGWSMPSRIHFRLDGSVPLGSSHHQKLVVIDDAVAFCGGLDLTIRRWDTARHRTDEPLRVDPDGEPYPPFHDVQMLVDGAAARALGELANERWATACGEDMTRPNGEDEQAHDPWPQSVSPDFKDVRVGIARTSPHYDGRPEVCEVEQLYLDSIEAAEQSIYIENQFLTFDPFAKGVAQRLRARCELEVLIVAPEKAESWIEYHSMRAGRIVFTRELMRHDDERVRLLYPEVSLNGSHTSTMVHAKVMIVDDRLLRVGSANLNNRSMAADTECDLVIEASCEADREAIRAVRARLIADHCGVPAERAAEEIALRGSLILAAETLSGHGHRLRPIDDGELDTAEISAYLQLVADPHDPIGVETVNDLFRSQLSNTQLSALTKLALVVLVLAVLTLVWQLTPLAEFANVQEVRETIASYSRSWFGGPLVIGLFVLAGLVSFPVTILIAATAAAFGPWPGIAYAGAGALASAIVTFAIGALLGREMLRGLLGPRLERAHQRIARSGVLAVAAIRMLPIAPFTVVNLAAGASGIRALDYVIGTILGLAPGLIVLSILGGQVIEMLTNPTPTRLALLSLAVAAWIGLAAGAQYALRRFARKSS